MDLKDGLKIWEETSLKNQTFLSRLKWVFQEKLQHHLRQTMKQDFCTLYLLLLFLCYTHSVTLSVCVFFSCHLSVQLSSFLRDLFAVLSIRSLIAVTVAAILFFNNGAHGDTVMFCDAIVSWPLDKKLNRNVSNVLSFPTIMPGKTGA